MTPDTTNDVDDPGTLRLGVVRASGASTDPTIAEMEARVVRAELERRVGPVTLDLRTDGKTVGPWLPMAHAAWPGDVDATIDIDDLGERAPHLVALFGRTVEPDAADVRSRMLEHLGVLPTGETALTDELLVDLLPAPARPTDLWLVVRAAADPATSDPAHRPLRLEPGADAVAAIDRWFDDVVAALPTDTTITIARLRAENIELRSRLRHADDELVRNERELLERIELLTAERDSLGERLDRAQLDPTGGPSA